MDNGLHRRVRAGASASTRVHTRAVEARVWTDAECERIHQATLEVLETIGVEVRSETALESFRKRGTPAEATRVRIPADLVEEALASAPRSYTVKSRSGSSQMLIQDGETYYGTGSDCPFFRDPDTGERRRARVADVKAMAALCEVLPNIDFVMSMGLPEDAPLCVVDVVEMAVMLQASRKPIIASPVAGDVVEILLKMASECGEPRSFLVYAEPVSPLVHDANGTSKLAASANLGVPVLYLSGCCAGATGPASVAGSVVVANAEVLSGLVLHQLVREGAPFVYGCGADFMDMRNGLYVHTAPETRIAIHAMTDMARFYGLPSFGFAGETESKLLDAQWSAEAALTTVLGGLSGATLQHDVGYMESQLQASQESIALGDELVGYVRAFCSGAPITDETIAVEEIRSVGPGGTYLGRSSTRRHHREFWRSSLLDHSRHGEWLERGSTTLLERVRERVDELHRGVPPVSLDERQQLALQRLLVSATRLRS